jgi:hypothetical protein
MPRKDRKEYNAYMRKYLPNYRRQERELLKKAKLQFGWIRTTNNRRKT